MVKKISLLNNKHGVAWVDHLLTIKIRWSFSTVNVQRILDIIKQVHVHKDMLEEAPELQWSK